MARQDRVAQDRVDPAAARVDLVGLARVVRLGLGIRVNQAAGMAATGREVTSRVVPEDTDLADLAVTILVGLVDPGNRVGLGDRAVQASPVVLAGTIPADLAARGRMVRALRAQGLRDRAARDVNPDRVLLDLTPTVPERAHLDRTPGHPNRRCPVDLGLTRRVHLGPTHPVDRRRVATARAEAARREAQARPADRTLRPGATPRAAPLIQWR